VQIVCLALFEEKLNKFLDYLIISRISGYPALPDIRQGNLVSGRIPDIKKGRIIRPDIRPAGYPVHPYFSQTKRNNFIMKESFFSARK
jgi:hypothetical protein